MVWFVEEGDGDSQKLEDRPWSQGPVSSVDITYTHDTTCKQSQMNSRGQTKYTCADSSDQSACDAGGGTLAGNTARGESGRLPRPQTEPFWGLEGCQGRPASTQLWRYSHHAPKAWWRSWHLLSVLSLRKTLHSHPPPCSCRAAT